MSSTCFLNQWSYKATTKVGSFCTFIYCMKCRVSGQWQNEAHSGLEPRVSVCESAVICQCVYLWIYIWMCVCVSSVWRRDSSLSTSPSHGKTLWRPHTKKKKKRPKCVLRLNYKCFNHFYTKWCGLRPGFSRHLKDVQKHYFPPPHFKQKQASE